MHRVTRDLVDVQTKRDCPGDERVIKTKYGSELTIFLFVAVLPARLSQLHAASGLENRKVKDSLPPHLHRKCDSLGLTVYIYRRCTVNMLRLFTRTVKTTRPGVARLTRDNLRKYEFSYRQDIYMYIQRRREREAKNHEKYQNYFDVHAFSRGAK